MGTDLESVRLKSQARDLKTLSDDLARRDKLLKIIPAEELARRELPAAQAFNGAGHHKQDALAKPTLNMIVADAKREKKFRKARQELSEVAGRIETRERLASNNEGEFIQKQNRLQESTDIFFRLYDGLKGPEMKQLCRAHELVKGEEVRVLREPSDSTNYLASGFR